MLNLTQFRFLSVRVAAQFMTISAAAFLAPVYLAAQGPAAAKSTTSAKATATAPAGKYVAPRLADGKPDFSGYWSFNLATPLERPDAFKGREFLRPDEVAGVQRATVRIDEKRVKGAPCTQKLRPGAVCRSADGATGDVGDYNAVFLEDGKKVVSTLRTSIIVDPKDGKMPSMTVEAKRMADADAEHQLAHPFDGPEDLSTGDRCITGRGTPYAPGAYNNNLHIVQSPGHIAMAAELMHDLRIIPIGGQPHGNVRQWLGDSVGHYEGDTLVVETTHFNSKRGWPNSNIGRRQDGKMKVTERFTRTAADVLMYEFTVDDPGMYTRPYSGELTMMPSKDPVYEYGCHEGNYSMPLILSGARTDEAKQRR